MRKLILVILFLLFSSSIANATLILKGTDVLGNRLIYDDDLNITWYDYTNSVPNTWQNHMDWASGLSVNFGGTIYDDWRLPETPNSDYIWTNGYDGTGTAGWNITNGELAHLFYTELGNLGQKDTSGVDLEVLGLSGLKNTGFFQNLISDGHYWYSTIVSNSAETGHDPSVDWAWDFYFPHGRQGTSNINGGPGDLGVIGTYAIAVRDGDVTATTITISIDKDSFLRGWWLRNLNEGANTSLVIQKFGYKRTVLSFDISGISTPPTTAWLVMTVAKKARYWGQYGRFVDVHRLYEPFTEGNGFVWGRRRADKDRGTGEGVTWRCASDADISNRRRDCDFNWWGGSKFMAVVATDSILHTNDLVAKDTVRWDVTNDVIAAIGEGETEVRWVVKKELERRWGKIVYYSKEGATAEGNTDLAPKLILE